MWFALIFLRGRSGSYFIARGARWVRFGIFSTVARVLVLGGAKWLVPELWYCNMIKYHYCINYG